MGNSLFLLLSFPFLDKSLELHPEKNKDLVGKYSEHALKTNWCTLIFHFQVGARGNSLRRSPGYTDIG